MEAAQKAWGDALVAISLAYESGGIAKAKPLASAIIDKAYGYNLGPVLFKPTLTQEPQTFRLTKEGPWPTSSATIPPIPRTTASRSRAGAR